MSKRVENGIILGGIVAIVIIAAYFEIIKQATFSTGEIECLKNESSYSFLSSPIQGTLNLNKFGGELPSKNSDDYRLVWVSIDIWNHSFLELKSAEFEMEVKETEESNNIVYYHGNGTLHDRETVLEDFVTKEMTTAFYLYVGDLKSDHEIEERLLNIIHQAEFKITYDMELVGVKEVKFKVPEEFDEVKFSTFLGEK